MQKCIVSLPKIAAIGFELLCMRLVMSICLHCRRKLVIGRCAIQKAHIGGFDTRSKKILVRLLVPDESVDSLDIKELLQQLNICDRMHIPFWFITNRRKIFNLFLVPSFNVAILDPE
jgi:hypothetical protein